MSTRNEHELARDLIFTRLLAAWAASGIDAGENKMHWPNARFQQPEPAAVWYRLSFQPGQTEPAALGPQKLNRTPFILILQVFMPDQTGTKPAFAAADALGSINNTAENLTNIATGTAMRAHFRTWSAPSFVANDGAYEQWNATLIGYYDTEPGNLI